MARSLLHEPVRLAGMSLMRVQSDARLVSLTRDGHALAFATIVDRHRPELLRHCRRIVGEPSAEDAVQQALINAHDAMLRTEDDIELRPWLHRIAHNASLNMLRARRTRDAAAALDDGGPARAAGADDVAGDRARFQELLSAIAALPQAQRDALLLRELEGRSHEHIAEALQVSVGGARQHLYRARSAVRAAMTAVTPYPLLSRLADLAAGGGADAGIARTGEVIAGTGLGALTAKFGVGALAAGAMIGGAMHHERATPPAAAGLPPVALTAPAHTRLLRNAPVTPAANPGTPATTVASNALRPVPGGHGNHHGEGHRSGEAEKHHGSGDSGSSSGKGSHHDDGGSGSSGSSGSGSADGGDADSSPGHGSSDGSSGAGSPGSPGSGEHESSGHGTGSGSSTSGSSGHDSSGAGDHDSSGSGDHDSSGSGDHDSSSSGSHGSSDGSGGSGSSGSGSSASGSSGSGSSGSGSSGSASSGSSSSGSGSSGSASSGSSGSSDASAPTGSGTPDPATRSSADGSATDAASSGGSGSSSGGGSEVGGSSRHGGGPSDVTPADPTPVAPQSSGSSSSGGGPGGDEDGA